MANNILLLVLLPALFAACALTPAADAGPAASEADADAGATPAPPAGTSAGASADRQAGPTAVHPASGELSLWSDASFRRRFAESYLAETEVEPRVTAAEREQMLQVMELIAADRLDDASALLQGQRGDEASAVFDFTLANIHFQREQLDLAAAAYDLAVAKYPKFRRAWKNLGVIRVREGEFAKARQALQRVIELGGADAVTYGLLGFACSNLDDHLAAESAYRMAVLLDPATVDWKMGLARCFFKQERYADAVSLGKGLIAAQPDRADLWLLQGNAYLGLNRPLQAAENLEMVDRLGRSTPDSLSMLGDIYVNVELYELAVRAYLRAMELSPEAGADRALRAAKVLTARGALAQTRQLVERIQATRQDRLDAAQQKDLLKLRARIAVAEGAAGEEVAVLQEIVALDPLDGEALILLGQHHARTKEPERAVFCYERAAGIEASEADAKVRHAQLLVGQQRYGEALPLLRRAQALKPRDNIQQYLEQVERVAQNR